MNSPLSKNISRSSENSTSHPLPHTLPSTARAALFFVCFLCFLHRSPYTARMNGYLIFVIALLIFNYVKELVIEWLDMQNLDTGIPDEYQGFYDEEKYAKSQRYQKETTRFGLVSATISLPITLAFIWFGGFKWVDDVARSADGGLIVTGLIFAGILMLLGQILSLPFSIYSTFVIEEKYGFNRTTIKTFILDLIKGLVMGILLGAALLSLVLWFFDAAGPLAWLYCWGAVTVFSLFLLYIYPVVFMPLFNKFEPLEDGELKDAINDYADKEGFILQGIFKMDGSKRSSKSNAFFTGFGRNRRVVLFDTLIENHSIPELVAVLAHEIGHFKLNHIKKMFASQIIFMGLMFFALSLFLHKAGMYEAFGLDYHQFIGTSAPIYAGLIFFQFLFEPISMLLNIFVMKASRKHEFEADEFAAKTTGESENMILALKKLTVDNLSDLYPHPLKVFLEFSHPPVLERIKAIRKVGAAN